MDTSLFSATLNQMAFLFALILIGWILAKCKLVPDSTAKGLSKLENLVFIPALVMGTFLKNFTVEYLSSAGKLLLGSLALAAVVIAVSVLLVRLLTKDAYLRKIYLYGLCFSNFGFVGNAVVGALFPEIFLEYIVFTLVLWALIYLWGVPALLMGSSDANTKPSLRETAKNFVNPMFIGMILGAVIGLSGIPVPRFVNDLVTKAGDCMSPIAMLLTGMTLASMPIKEILKIKSVYAVTFLRLIVYPLLLVAVALIVPLPRIFLICAVCALAMPFGMNTIVIPNAYGKDCSAASGAVLVSHILACATIPLIFYLLTFLALI